MDSVPSTNSPHITGGEPTLMTFLGTVRDAGTGVPSPASPTAAEAYPQSPSAPMTPPTVIPSATSGSVLAGLFSYIARSQLVSAREHNMIAPVSH